MVTGTKKKDAKTYKQIKISVKGRKAMREVANSYPIHVNYAGRRHKLGNFSVSLYMSISVTFLPLLYPFFILRNGAKIICWRATHTDWPPSFFTLTNVNHSFRCSSLDFSSLEEVHFHTGVSVFIAVSHGRILTTPPIRAVFFNRIIGNLLYLYYKSFCFKEFQQRMNFQPKSQHMRCVGPLCGSPIVKSTLKSTVVIFLCKAWPPISSRQKNGIIKTQIPQIQEIATHNLAT